MNEEIFPQSTLTVTTSMRPKRVAFLVNPEETNEDELNEMISQKLCIICASKKVDVAFVDCGHMISCEKCANIIKNDIKYKRKCPICRKDIKNILKIYM